MSDKTTKTPPAPAEATDFLAVFNSATADDLARIQGSIAVKEKELDGLRAIEKILAVKINGAPIRAAHGAKKAARAAEAAGADSTASVMERRKKVLMYLRANGAKSLDKISEATGISRLGPNCLTVVVRCDWFHTSPENIVSVTDKGDRAYPVS